MAVFGRNSVTDEKHAQPVVYGQMFLCAFPAMSIYNIACVEYICVFWLRRYMYVSTSSRICNVINET